MAHTAAVVDVGSHTVRLVVASCTPSGVKTTHTKRARLELGRELEEDGRLSDETIAATAETVRELCATARAKGTASLDVVVTAPGRQAENGAELAHAIERAAGAPVRILSGDDEARLAFAGAVASAESPPARLVAVVDLGGASTEIAVGRPESGPVWSRSFDVGALRLTTAVLDEQRDVEAARLAVAEAFDGLAPPLPGGALVVGGSARALRRVVGKQLGADELEAAAELLVRCAPEEVALEYGVGKRRAPLLLAAALILAEVQRRLFVPLEVVEGGMREGALLVTLEAAAA